MKLKNIYIYIIIYFISFIFLFHYIYIYIDIQIYKCDCLYICLKKLACRRALIIPLPVLDIFASWYKGVQNMQATLQRSGSATDNGYVTFTVWYQRLLCGACVCLCLFLLLNVVYLPIYAKLGLVVGMTKQISDGKEPDIVNC